MSHQLYDPNLELVRITTAGSIDDGKSTLIGRLLFDLKQIYDDQLESIAKYHKPLATGTIDFSLVTDGLMAEREQKITIDVAYRHFITPHRKFIVADVPGHVQYTRNMATGASTADILVIIADVQHPLHTQTKQHLLIARLFAIPHVIIAVNKMDLVDYNKEPFQEFKQQILEYSENIGLEWSRCVPVSALCGEGIVRRSSSMSWYHGPSILEYLETLQIKRYSTKLPLRYPIQLVFPPVGQFSRGYAGRILSGTIHVGQEVRLLPSGLVTKIKNISLGDRSLIEANNPLSVCVGLTGEYDLSRGDSLVDVNQPPLVTSELVAELLWMGRAPLRVGESYFLKHTTKQVRCTIRNLKRSQFKAGPSTTLKTVQTNELARVSLTSASPLIIENFLTNRFTGIFILIDEFTSDTVAICTIIAGI